MRECPCQTDCLRLSISRNKFPYAENEDVGGAAADYDDVVRIIISEGSSNSSSHNVLRRSVRRGIVLVVWPFGRLGPLGAGLAVGHLAVAAQQAGHVERLVDGRLDRLATVEHATGTSLKYHVLRWCMTVVLS